MPIHFLATAADKWVPSDYVTPAIASLLGLATVKGWAGGVDWLARLDPRNGGPGERDLHGRVVLIVGGFTPLGLVVQSSLAARGAQIVALTPNMASPRVLQLVQLLRDSTDNQLIYAEQCDVLQPSSVTTFAETWNKGLTQSRKTNPLAGAAGSGGGGSEAGLRLDAMVLLPLAETTYSMGEGKQRMRSAGKGGGVTWANYELSHAEVAARYHLVQSMLSSLLLLPPDRDIRIISACSPWYAAGLATFSSQDPDYENRPFPTWQPWCAAGAAAIHWLALTHELQRRLDSLAEADTRPRGPLAAVDPSNADMRSVSREAERRSSRSNLRIVNVCLGFERNADLLPYLLPPVQPEQAPIVDRDSKANGKQQDQDDEEHEELLEQLRARVDPRTTPSNGSSSHQSYPVAYAPATHARGHVSTFSAAMRYILATLLWPLIWLFAKSPASAASGVTWAIVARDPMPVVLHREGEPRRVQMPKGAREPAEQRALWEAEERRAKDALRKRA